MSSQFYSAGPFYQDMAMLSSYSPRMQDNTMDTFIDPNLETAAHSFPDPWHPYLNSNPLLSAMPSRSTGAVTPVQYHRHPSPMSSHSPRADTESSYDHPTTPPDTTMYSPYLPSLPLESFPVTHGAHEFRHMGPGMGMGAFVNLGDVNPAQHHDCADSDHGFGDFKLPLRQFSFDSYPASQCDYDLTPNTNTNTNTSHRLATPDDIPVIKQEITAASASQYPPPPRRSKSVSSDEDNISLAPSTRRARESSDNDEDYEPKPKRTRPATQAAPRRNPRPAPAASASTSQFALGSVPSTQRRRPTSTKPASPPASIPPSLPASRAPKFICTQPSCQSKAPFTSQPDLDAHTKKQHTRPFICVFHFAGCPSTFASKNEWKRHVTTQHLLLTYWLCTEGSCATAKTAAIFNRKDLFTQHLKRMHCPPQLKKLVMGKGSQENKEWEDRLRVMQARGVRERCKLPEVMCCPVRGCDVGRFEGKDAWDMRMEHVAKHLEKEKDGVEFGGVSDGTLTGWAGRDEVGIIVGRPGGGWELKKPLERQPAGGAANKGGAGVVVVVLRGRKEESSEEEEQEQEQEEEDAEGEED